MKVALCDDDLPELESLKRLIDDYCARAQASLEFSCFSSGEDLLSLIGQGHRFDILFLDIVMGAANGIIVARKIREFDTACSIIFATSSRDYAIEGYGVKALQYLLKPIEAEALDAALDAAIEAHRVTAPRIIHIITRQNEYRVPISDIVFAESSARVITVHRRDNEAIRFYERLDAFERRCQDGRFLRCHKSFLVNMDYVQSIAHNSAILKTGQELPVSISLSRAKELFASYAVSKI